MHESVCCAEVAAGLARHGMPAARIERVTSELAEHWEDARAEGLEKGLSAAEAASQADKRLGEPQEIARHVIAGSRRSSWLGRHPITALCILPFFFAPALMAVIAFPLALLDGWTHFTHWGGSDSRPNAYLITGLAWALHYSTTIAALLWLCRHAWRNGLGTRWILALCLWCALTALIRFFNADPVGRNVVFGFRFPWRLDIHTAIILLVHGTVAAGFFVASSAVTKRSDNRTQTTALV